MISQKDLKSYEYETIDGYYFHIVDSQINGNFSQVLRLYKKLSNYQKKEFILNCFAYAQMGHYPKSDISRCLANCFNISA